MSGRHRQEPADACGYSCGSKAEGTVAVPAWPVGSTAARACRSCAEEYGADFTPDEITPRRVIDDPRQVGGDLVGEADPHGQDSVLVDMHRAVLLDDISMCEVQETGTPLIALRLSGRIYRSEDLARVVFLLDLDDTALLMTHLLALVTRIGPEALDQVMTQAREINIVPAVEPPTPAEPTPAEPAGPADTEASTQP